MKLGRTIFCASAMALAVNGAFANEYYGYAEERGMSSSSIPPSVDETGTVRSPAQAEDPVLVVAQPAPEVIVAQPAPAAPVAAAPINVNELFARLDINRDGRIGPQEANLDPTVSRMFEWADRNNSNALDPSELADAVAAAQRTPNVDALFSSYDVNRDGMISWQEAQADPALARWFVGRDRSTTLSRAEFERLARG